MHRTFVLVLLFAGVALGQAPEPILPPPRVVPADAAGDPLPAGAVARFGTLRWRHGGPVQFAGFAADGRELVSASLDGWIRVWDPASGRELRRWQWHPGGAFDDDDFRPGSATVRSIVLSPDRRLLAASLASGQVRVWNLKGETLHTLGEPNFNLVHGSNGIAFAPDGKTLASRGDDHVIRLWDLRTGKETGKLSPPADTQPLRGNSGQIFYYGRVGNTLAYSPDGKTLAAMNSWNTEAARGIVILYDMEVGKELRRIEGGERSLSGRLAFGPSVLGVAWGNRETKLYDPDTGKELRPLGEPQDNVIIHALAFSPDGKSVASRSASSTPSIYIWEVASGKRLQELGDLAVSEPENLFVRLSGPGSSTMTIDFSPDGQRLAEAPGSRVVRVWQVK